MENESAVDVSTLVLIGSLGMLLLAFSVILFVALYQKKILAQQNIIQVAETKHQKDMLNATIEVAEIEREKIAKNIHDDIGTILNVIKLNFSKMSRNPGDKALTELLIKESMSLLDDSIQNIRGIAKDLMPPTLIKLGFEKGIAELCRQINASGMIVVNCHFNLSETRLPAKTELQLYRIMQEVINNIIKHSQATLVNITGRSNANGLNIDIMHDGKGLSSEMIEQLPETEKGIGLKSIQSRVQLINASLQYFTIGPQQAGISIEVPFSVYEEIN
ncbi:MAG: ATP-binding protein [Bacteroidia bacterium]